MRRLQPSPNKILPCFIAVLLSGAALFAQDGTSYLTPEVIRVGSKLACRCGGCRNTVGDCPMLRCGSADPLRHRIFDMKSQGTADSEIVNAIVREEGIVALASPPGEGLWPVLTWIMPGLMLILGFFVYSAYVRRNRRAPTPLSDADHQLLERYRDQLDELPGSGAPH